MRARGAELVHTLVAMLRRTLLTLFVVVLALALPVGAHAKTTDKQVAAAALKLQRAKGGPPGLFLQVFRRGTGHVYWIGRRDRKKAGGPDLGDKMRIASMTKAITGAIALRAVQSKRLSLDDTVGKWLPDMPLAWHPVTIRQLMNHTSGIPDYTRSEGFANQFSTAPKATVLPATLIDWVRTSPMNFPAGSAYAYSNTDNILVGLIVEKIYGKPYGKLVRDLVTKPLGMIDTKLPTGTSIARPTIRGYVVDGKNYEDVTTALSPSGAWASGGLVSTPNDMATFFGTLLQPGYFSSSVKNAQRTWVPGGQSSPAGPGSNSAGLSLFRYKTRCGIVYGHTGSFPGYTQFAAASKDGSVVVTSTLNISDPAPKLLKQLRELQTKAVCLGFKR